MMTSIRERIDERSQYVPHRGGPKLFECMWSLDDINEIGREIVTKYYERLVILDGGRRGEPV
jgi:hypothetical protein